MLKNVFILALMALRNRKYRALTIKKRINSVFTLFLIQIPHTGIIFDDRGFESLLRRYRSFLLSTASTQTSVFSATSFFYEPLHFTNAKTPPILYVSHFEGVLSCFIRLFYSVYTSRGIYLEVRITTL